jgi:hypothetical protein
VDTTANKLATAHRVAPTAIAAVEQAAGQRDELSLARRRHLTLATRELTLHALELLGGDDGQLGRIADDMLGIWACGVTMLVFSVHPRRLRAVPDQATCVSIVADHF